MLLVGGLGGCRRSPEGPLFAAPVGPHWGFIDSHGHTVIDGRFDQVRRFSEGRAAVELSGRWGYIDRTGTVVIPAVQRAAHDFHAGAAIVDSGQPDQPFGLMDSSGSWIVPPSFRSLLPGDFGAGQFFIGQKAPGDLAGFYDRSGRLVFGPYEMAFPFSEGFARVTDGASAILTSAGEIKLRKKNFESIRFSENVIAVRWVPKVGYMDGAGRMVIPPRWDEGGDFKEGLAPVRDGTLWFFIDHAGNVAAKLPETVRHADPLSDGRSLVSADRSVPGRKLGYVDRTGQWAVPPQWDHADAFENGLARVVDWRTQKTAYIDLTGRTVWEGHTP